MARVKQSSEKDEKEAAKVHERLPYLHQWQAVVGVMFATVGQVLVQCEGKMSLVPTLPCRSL